MTAKNRVLRALESDDGRRCVDIFARPDGGFGFAEIRRDPEDPRGWGPVGGPAARRYDSAAAALAGARVATAWLAAMMARNED